MLAEAHREGFEAAVSNPCIEVWFQLHFTDSPDATPRKRESKARAAKRAWGKLRASLSDDTPWPFTAESVQAAIERGRATDNDDWIPDAPGTHVHRLVWELLRFSSQ